MTADSIRPYEEEVKIDAFVASCVDVPRFHSLCRACPSYATTWSCPPFDFSVEELWHSYDSILLCGRKYIPPPKLLEREYPQDEISAIAADILAPVKRQLASELMAMEKRTSDSLALLAGRCECCADCARLSGKPCFRPDRMRYSIEALGGNVSAACERYFGEKLLWAEKGRLPAHFFLLGGLLKRTE